MHKFEIVAPILFRKLFSPIYPVRNLKSNISLYLNSLGAVIEKFTVLLKAYKCIPFEFLSHFFATYVSKKFYWWSLCLPYIES